MSTIVISPQKLSGSIKIPPSKSDAHRAIICAALSKGISTIKPVYLSDDIKATIKSVSKLGAKIDLISNKLIINGENTFSKQNIIINCQESASTLRFLIPVAAARGVKSTFVGTGNLPSRPIGVYLNCLPQFGVNFQTNSGLPLKLSGKLRAGNYKIPGNISSQFISGLLFALPLLNDDSTIEITNSFESSAYVDMTINTKSQFGINIETLPYEYKISGKQKYRPNNYIIEGDYSQAAFFISAAILGNKIKILGLNKNSHQGDIKAIKIFKDFGANIKWSFNELIISPSVLHGIKIDASQIPDLVPILAVTACFAEGTTEITNAARLRMKECDRLNAISKTLNKLGANIKETQDGLIIKGVKSLKSGTVDSFNDHRIAMALSIAAIMADGDIRITNAQSINKSYPTFFEDYNKLGGNSHVIDMG